MTMITESNAVRAAHHLEEASKYAYAIFWAQSLYKETLNEQFTKALKAAAEAAGYTLVKAEEKEK